MKYEINQSNNFCRVFQLPHTFPEDYCFGGGFPCQFKIVDWFNPVNYEEDIKLVAEGKPDKTIGQLSSFIKRKSYYNPNFKYIVICDFGLTFQITDKSF